jgi:hypothetical protein
MTFLFSARHGSAQEAEVLPKHAVQVALGASYYMDLVEWGPAVTARYTYFINDRLSWHAFAGGTVHNGLDTVYHWNNAGDLKEGVVDYTKAGVQIGAGIGRSFLRNARHNFSGTISMMARYQSSSYPYDYGYSTTYPFQGLNMRPFPARIFTGGLVLSTSYDYSFKFGLFIGAEAWLQYETNQDAQAILSFIVGRRL